MKKIVLASVCLLAVCAQPALAWKNVRFSMGLNYQYQSGNNDFMWGLWHNGQVPPPVLAYPPPVAGFVPPPVFSPVPVVPGSQWAPPLPLPAPAYNGNYGAPIVEPPIAAGNAPLYRHATFVRP